MWKDWQQLKLNKWLASDVVTSAHCLKLPTTNTPKNPGPRFTPKYTEPEHPKKDRSSSKAVKNTEFFWADHKSQTRLNHNKTFRNPPKPNIFLHCNTDALLFNSFFHMWTSISLLEGIVKIIQQCRYLLPACCFPERCLTPQKTAVI